MSTITLPLLIAVDGGGTGCRVAVGTRADGVLGEAKGGPANVNTNFERATGNIVEATKVAMASAGLPDSMMTEGIAHLGLAGADLAELRARTVAALPFGATRVTGDRQTTVAGVLGDHDGFVIALGTGTIIARQRGGEIKTVSGWGFAVSDTASGAWLGRTLLARVLDAEEGLDPTTPLTRAIATHFGDVQGVFHFSTTATPADYATFAPQVIEAGKAGDPLALEILQSAATYLAKGLTALGFAQGDVLSLAGGVGPHYAPYLPAPFTDNLCPPRGNALQGAFTLAKQLAASQGT